MDPSASLPLPGRAENHRSDITANITMPLAVLYDIIKEF